MAVVAFHAGLPVGGGFVGVDVFFVISGLVIGTVLLDEIGTTGRLDLGAFFARRMRRLVPLLALVVGVTLVVHAATTNPFTDPVVARTGLASLVFVANVSLYRHTGYFDLRADEANPLLHLWSLSVEEQFYVALPLTILAVAAVTPRVHRRRTVAAVVAAMAMASFALCVAFTAGWAPIGIQAPRRLAFFASVTRFWEMGAGVLLAVGAPRLARMSAVTATALAAFGALVGAGALFLTDPRGPFPGPTAAFAVLGTAALLAAGGARPSVTRALTFGPLRWVGDRSYGWYLWHWPAIVLARHLLPGGRLVPFGAAMASLGVAAVTYPRVEQRWRRDTTLVGRRAIGFALSVVALPTVLGLAAVRADHHGWGLDEPDGWYDNAAPTYRGCIVVNRDLPNEWPEQHCVERRQGATGDTVLVVGDSAAGSVVAAVGPAADASRVAVWGRAGCPFVARPVPGFPRCEEWQSAVWGLADRLDPDLLVVANRSLDHARGPDPVAGSGPARDRWGVAVDEMLAEAGRRSLPVVLVGPVPDYGEDFPRVRLSPVARHPTVPDLTSREVEARRSDVVTVEQAAVNEHAHAVYFDPVPSLCVDGCRPLRDGRWLYADGHHLNRVGAALLVDALRMAIETVTRGR